MKKNNIARDVLHLYSFVRRYLCTNQINSSNVYNWVFTCMTGYCIRNGIPLFSDQETITEKYRMIQEFHQLTLDGCTGMMPNWQNMFRINSRELRKSCEKTYGVRIDSFNSYIPFIITKLWSAGGDDDALLQEFIRSSGAEDLIVYHEENLMSGDPYRKNNAYHFLLTKLCGDYFLYLAKNVFGNFTSAKFLNHLLGGDNQLTGFVRIPGKIVWNECSGINTKRNGGDILCDYCFNYVVAGDENDHILYVFTRTGSGTKDINKSEYPRELYLGRKVLITGELSGKSVITGLDMWANELVVHKYYLL